MRVRGIWHTIFPRGEKMQELECKGRGIGADQSGDVVAVQCGPDGFHFLCCALLEPLNVEPHIPGLQIAIKYGCGQWVEVKVEQLSYPRYAEVFHI